MPGTFRRIADQGTIDLGERDRGGVVRAPGDSTISAEMASAIVAAGLPRVEQNSAVCQFDDLILVGIRSLRDVADLPGFPMVVRVVHEWLLSDRTV